MTAVYGYDRAGEPRKPRNFWPSKKMLNDEKTWDKYLPQDFNFSPSDPVAGDTLTGPLVFKPIDFSRQTSRLIGLFIRWCSDIGRDPDDPRGPWFHLRGRFSIDRDVPIEDPLHAPPFNLNKENVYY